MKHLEKVTKRLFLLVIILTISILNGFSQDPDPMDSVEVSLITCSPHEEIYSLYGHSAIRWHDLRQGGPEKGQDLVFNWGMFSFSKPFFALRFVFGLTDYELVCMNADTFWPYYKKWGSSVTEQVLNLTADEKRKVQQALAENLRPENRIYRYNFFYDNCSTRPRDIIERNLNGKVIWPEQEGRQASFREMVRECNRNHLWSKAGNDILLGLKADKETNRIEQEFLPVNLMIDMAKAQVYENGIYRPLVMEQRTIVPPGVQFIEPDWIMTPTQLAILLLILSVAISWIEWRRKKTFKWLDVFLMTIQGLAGIALTAMLFSQHPTTTLNLNYLLFNPLPFFFIPSVIRRKKIWWSVQMVMLVLYAIGAFFQSYPEGMGFLALCLLIRILINEK
ncbi:MAG: DUF4105 domain-containing protein [Prevotella sp.]|nr:DUF4105 domain-containing protein [Prevotella sp.]